MIAKIVFWYLLVGVIFYLIMVVYSSLLKNHKKATDQDKINLSTITDLPVIVYIIFMWPIAVHMLFNKSALKKATDKAKREELNKLPFNERLQKIAEEKKKRAN